MHHYTQSYVELLIKCVIKPLSVCVWVCIHKYNAGEGSQIPWRWSSRLIRAVQPGLYESNWSPLENLCFHPLNHLPRPNNDVLLTCNEVHYGK